MNKGDRNSGIQPLNDTPRRSCQDCFAKTISDNRQSTHIKDQTPALANVMCSISGILSVSQSHIYIIVVVANLNVEYDNCCLDEPFSLKETMVSLYWKDFIKDIYAEFQFFIKNDTWKYKDPPSSQAVLTDCWVFKITKNR